jgi:hypothetical protein
MAAQERIIQQHFGLVMNIRRDHAPKGLTYRGRAGRFDFDPRQS